MYYTWVILTAKTEIGFKMGKTKKQNPKTSTTFQNSSL